jgi:hypothetical protein
VVYLEQEGCWAYDWAYTGEFLTYTHFIRYTVYGIWLIFELYIVYYKVYGIQLLFWAVYRIPYTELYTELYTKLFKKKQI